MFIQLLPQVLSNDFSLQAAVQVSSIIAAFFAVSSIVVTRTAPWISAKLRGLALHKGLGSVFSRVQIERAVRYYITPMCQDVDPAGAEEPRLVFGVRQKLFGALDQALSHPTEFRYVLLLADSGMGKTCALINVYARHSRKWLNPYKMVLIPLGIPDADSRISAVEEKNRTILLLDAFDEDTQAIVDHVERLRLILRATHDFYRVLITCRTQFFSADEEIPRRTGLIKVASRAAGEPAEYMFHKIYISPFSEREVKAYLDRRYPFWRPKKRKAALEAVRMMPNLSVRPMLLAHVDDLIRAGREIRYSFELYEEMVEAWLVREEGFVRDKENLRQFSELLAVDLYVNRAARGAERIQATELEALALDWRIPIEKWILTGRSLLNRDSEGNYKFAHRSIMEYLIVVRTSKNDARALRVPWTDQMGSFLSEIVEFQCSTSVKSSLFCGLVKTISFSREVQYRGPREGMVVSGADFLGHIVLAPAGIQHNVRKFMALLGGLLPAPGLISIKRVKRIGLVELREAFLCSTVLVGEKEIVIGDIDDDVLDWVRIFVAAKLKRVAGVDLRNDNIFKVTGDATAVLEFNCKNSLTDSEQEEVFLAISGLARVFDRIVFGHM